MDDEIIKYMPLALHISKKYSSYAGEYDDLVMIYLIKAVRSYDASKGTRLSTYISMCIKRGLTSEWRKNKNPKYTFSLDLKVYDGNESVSLQDLIIEDNVDLDKYIEDDELKEIIKNVLLSLEEEDAYILKRVYGIDVEQVTQTELAKELNVTVGCLQKRYMKALKNARKEIHKWIKKLN